MFLASRHLAGPSVDHRVLSYFQFLVSLRAARPGAPRIYLRRPFFALRSPAPFHALTRGTAAICEARRSVVGTTSHTRIALMPKLNRDDVALYFKDEGSGTAPPMLFVHGWGCDHTFFAPQQAHFSHFQRTIAVDLRGHGASSAPIQDYTVEGFVDDLAHLCRELTLPKSIVVGHSMVVSI